MISRIYKLRTAPAIFGSVLLCLAGCISPANKPATGDYPVRTMSEVHLPPNISLEDLKDLPVEELNHPETGWDGITMSRGGDTNLIIARTWREFTRAGVQGFEPASNADLQMSG